MRLRPFALIALLAIALSPACKDKDHADPSASGSILPAGVKAGSHEDWCDEHQVPESQCTRCHPELIPAFKAAGDWDDAHHLPLSQCTQCSPPHKPVRPPKST